MTIDTEGSLEVTYRMLGYRTKKQNINFVEGNSLWQTVILQEELSDLDEVVVSASRNSEYLSEIPASVTVVNEAKLKELSKATSNISEILEFTVPGLAASTGTFSNWGKLSEVVHFW